MGRLGTFIYCNGGQFRVWPVSSLKELSATATSIDVEKVISMTQTVDLL